MRDRIQDRKDCQSQRNAERQIEVKNENKEVTCLQTSFSGKARSLYKVIFPFARALPEKLVCRQLF